MSNKYKNDIKLFYLNFQTIPQFFFYSIFDDVLNIEIFLIDHFLIINFPDQNFELSPRMISFHLFLLASLSHAQSNCENCNADGYIEKERGQFIKK